ncbi:hypothetical protein KP509_15G024400 [Ceratopteris richardii]|uniref:fructose-bisphosphatase n=2 Tax=Ceratopteris richardii TaxID=49495 RepID=A0A8T2T5I1_CERRI|nr:hypothetical protein KP509_15G024400 [Ceratopteris richardii]
MQTTLYSPRLACISIPSLSAYPHKALIDHSRSKHLSPRRLFTDCNYLQVIAKVAAESHSQIMGSSGDGVLTGDHTLLSFLGRKDSGSDDELIILLSHVQAACAKIASLLASPSTVKAACEMKPSSPSVTTSGRDAPKPLDLVANDIIKAALKCSGKAAVIASEEDEMPIWLNDTAPYVVVFDPLDGSRNIDASIPTGSIFGIYRRLEETDGLPEAEKAELNVLQRGEKLVAAVYSLYSSATVLCVSIGSGAHVFTLDRSNGDFVLTNSNLMMPTRGQIYSVNDARYFDWPEGLRNYIDDVRQGKGQNPKKYSARYICSLVADFHRTVLYGGLAMNPRAHLRLVYEANPLSFIAEQSGGKGSDGKRRILDIQPIELHQRLPLFLGSADDISELLSYKNIQQLVNPGYEV